jgi:hypothetical protein
MADRRWAEGQVLGRRYHSPSTIFMDELDALMTQRDGCAPLRSPPPA